VTVTDIRRPMGRVEELMPGLTREARREGLMRLAKAYTEGTPPAETDAAVLICVYASDRLDADHAIDLFAEYVDEVRRAIDCRNWEPKYRDVDLAMCEADRDACLNDLVHFTNSYRGTRCH
jgi:hypothetical protein